MTRAPSNQDLLLLDRFLDGAMSEAEMADCRSRLEAEPRLRAALQDRQRLRRGFAAGRDAVVTPRPGFAASVVAATRRLPVGTGDEQTGVVVRFCRRALLAAAALVAAALLWQSGVFHDRGDGTLQAAPDEAQRIIDALDARIREDAERK